MCFDEPTHLLDPRLIAAINILTGHTVRRLRGSQPWDVSGPSALRMIHSASVVFLFNKSALTLRLGPGCDVRGLPFGFL